MMTVIKVTRSILYIVYFKHIAMIYILIVSGVVAVLVVVAVAAAVPNQGHILNQNQSPNPNLLNVAAPDLNPSEYLFFCICVVTSNFVM